MPVTLASSAQALDASVGVAPQTIEMDAITLESSVQKILSPYIAGFSTRYTASGTQSEETRGGADGNWDPRMECRYF